MDADGRRPRLEAGARASRTALPRYAHDNLFDATKFKRRFLEFEVTTYRRGLELIRQEPRRDAA